MSVITLTTDFGSKDWFVGTMKGVILGIAPRAAIVDLTHEVPSGAIRAGAFALAASCRFFPKGTIHLAVVDPGVGSARNAIAVQTADFFFVGPDNGVLSFALARQKITSVRTLTNRRFFLHSISHTFHGRDIFAPVAAHLSRGISFSELGRPLQDFVRLDWPHPKVLAGQIEGEVIYVDRFGNAITNIHEEDLPRGAGHPLFVYVGRRRLCGMAESYQSVRLGKPVAVPGSSGFLEVAVNGGSAAHALGLKVGRCLRVTPGPERRS